MLYMNNDIGQKIDESKYPFLRKTIEYLNSKTVIFQKYLLEMEKSDFNFSLGENLCKKAFLMSGQNWDLYYDRVDSLIRFSYEYLFLQKNLEKSGRYLYSSYEEVEKNAYQNDASLTGPQYIWGMYFSLFFWPGRNKIYKFFHNDFVKNKAVAGMVLEAPIGAGTFMADFLTSNSGWTGVGVDISESSIEFTKNYLKLDNVLDRIKIVKENIYKFKYDGLFNKILCGDFLEHVEDPLGILEILYNLLEKDGQVFISVAVWAANIDHIYLYKSVREVRDHIYASNFRIDKELIHNVVENHKPEQEKTPIHYCAILSKNNKSLA